MSHFGFSDCILWRHRKKMNFKEWPNFCTVYNPLLTALKVFYTMFPVEFVIHTRKKCVAWSSSSRRCLIAAASARYTLNINIWWSAIRLLGVNMGRPSPVLATRMWVCFRTMFTALRPANCIEFSSKNKNHLFPIFMQMPGNVLRE